MVSVTKLIDILNKPALLYWSNKIGLEGINIRDYKKESTSKGTSKHIEIENYINNLDWFEGCDKFIKALMGYEIIGCEVDVSNKHLIGRIDLVLKKDNLTYIVDLKSNKNIYLSTKLQLSTYKHLYNADKICVMELDTFKLEEIKIDTNKYYEIIKRLFQINELIINLKEKL